MRRIGVLALVLALLIGLGFLFIFQTDQEHPTIGELSHQPRTLANDSPTPPPEPQTNKAIKRNADPKPPKEESNPAEVSKNRREKVTQPSTVEPEAGEYLITISLDVRLDGKALTLSDEVLALFNLSFYLPEDEFADFEIGTLYESKSGNRVSWKEESLENYQSSEIYLEGGGEVFWPTIGWEIEISLNRSTCKQAIALQATRSAKGIDLGRVSIDLLDYSAYGAGYYIVEGGIEHIEGYKGAELGTFREYFFYEIDSSTSQCLREFQCEQEDLPEEQRDGTFRFVVAKRDPFLMNHFEPYWGFDCFHLYDKSGKLLPLANRQYSASTVELHSMNLGWEEEEDISIGYLEMGSSYPEYRSLGHTSEQSAIKEVTKNHFRIAPFLFDIPSMEIEFTFDFGTRFAWDDTPKSEQAGKVVFSRSGSVAEVYTTDLLGWEETYFEVKLDDSPARAIHLGTEGDWDISVDARLNPIGKDETKYYRFEAGPVRVTLDRGKPKKVVIQLRPLECVEVEVFTDEGFPLLEARFHQQGVRLSALRVRAGLYYIYLSSQQYSEGSLTADHYGYHEKRITIKPKRMRIELTLKEQKLPPLKPMPERRPIREQKPPKQEAKDRRVEVSYRLPLDWVKFYVRLREHHGYILNGREVWPEERALVKGWIEAGDTISQTFRFPAEVKELLLRLEFTSEEEAKRFGFEEGLVIAERSAQIRKDKAFFNFDSIRSLPRPSGGQSALVARINGEAVDYTFSIGSPESFESLESHQSFSDRGESFMRAVRIGARHLTRAERENAQVELKPNFQLSLGKVDHGFESAHLYRANGDLQGSGTWQLLEGKKEILLWAPPGIAKLELEGYEENYTINCLIEETGVTKFDFKKGSARLKILGGGYPQSFSYYMRKGGESIEVLQTAYDHTSYMHLAPGRWEFDLCLGEEVFSTQSLNLKAGQETALKLPFNYSETFSGEALISLPKEWVGEQYLLENLSLRFGFKRGYFGEMELTRVFFVPFDGKILAKGLPIGRQINLRLFLYGDENDQFVQYQDLEIKAGKRALLKAKAAKTCPEYLSLDALSEVDVIAAQLDWLEEERHFKTRVVDTENQEDASSHQWSGREYRLELHAIGRDRAASYPALKILIDRTTQKLSEAQKALVKNWLKGFEDMIFKD